MKNYSRSAVAFLLAMVLASPAHAKVCDYRPSKLIGGTGTAALTSGGAVVAGTGAAAKAAGIYTLTHSVTGLTMLGSTMAGPSAAGTVGIIAGTGGAIGTVGAIVTAPATIAAGVVVAVVTGGFEGVCYFRDEKITDYDEVLAIMEDLSSSSDPAYFRLYVRPNEESIVYIKDDAGEMKRYKVSELFIVEGVLKVDDWGVNTTIGNIGLKEVSD